MSLTGDEIVQRAATTPEPNLSSSSWRRRSTGRVSRASHMSGVSGIRRVGDRVLARIG